MNKKLFSVALIAAATMTLGFTSCSDDDDKKENEEVIEKKASEEIAGTYTGGIYITSAYFRPTEMPEKNQTVTITANEDGETVTVAFSHSTSEEYYWGDFKYENVSVTKNEDGSFSIAGEGVCANMLYRGRTQNPMASNVTGTIVGGELVADFALPSLMGVTVISFNPADFDEVFAAANQSE